MVKYHKPKFVSYQKQLGYSIREVWAFMGCGFCSVCSV